jgi:hypothetical protein
MRTEAAVEHELMERIARALVRTAIKRGVLSYQRFHDLCGPGLSYTERYGVLEKAVECVSDPRILDYGVLLALDSGLPGDDYFRRFYRYRHDEYVKTMGDPRIQRQSVKQKWALVRAERLRAYEDARLRRDASADKERAGASCVVAIPTPGLDAPAVDIAQSMPEEPAPRVIWAAQ